MPWEPSLQPHDPADAAGGRPPRVVIRGLGWRLVVNYLRELGGQLVVPPEANRGQARLSGQGWEAVLQEQVEFRGALRLNRVEVRFSGQSEAIEGVLAALRRMALLEGPS